jgi:hypothetical protein
MTQRTVTIVGAGALGSHLLLFRSNWDVSAARGRLRPRGSQRTPQSQFHSVMGMGKNKAKAIQSAMQGLFKRPDRPSLTSKLTDDNQSELLGGSDLVIDCTDNFAARQCIQDYCSSAEIPCLHGALSAEGDLARVVWSEHFVADQEGQPGQATCEDGQNLPFHGLAASLIAQIAQAIPRRRYQAKLATHAFRDGPPRLS